MTPIDALEVFDHGYVRLESANASDLSVINSARVSFNQRQDVVDDRGIGLINFLMREHHGTPFEHNSFTFVIRAPLFVVREWQRHRIGSYNEESGRYSEFEPLFYVPTYVRTQIGKPGAYTFKPVDNSIMFATQEYIEENNRQAFGRYEAMLSMGVAKEVARMVLPVNIYSTFYWTVNARSLMNFLFLRNSDFAQYEIREYAKAIERLFEAHMPVTHAAYVACGRQTP